VELAMQNIIKTFLVVLICLVCLSTSVQAQTSFEVPVGGIAIIGFNSDDTSQFAFVCLTQIPSNTVIYFTDRGWSTTNNTFWDGEGKITWNTPGGCQLGQIVTINQFDLPMIGTFQLSNGGDQILVYQGSDASPSFIFAINFEQSDWQGSSNSANTSARPPGLDATNSVAIVEIDNSIHTGGQEFDFPATVFDSPTLALASIVDKTHWKGSNDTRQTMPFGFFSFKTTAVHLSGLSAESGGENAPWFVILGLVVIPVLVMVVRRPKRDCCK
jgi:hypothetical protein